MKRRSFLGLLGAAFSAPLMPPAAAGGSVARAAPYSPAALHAAIYHAKSRSVFSVCGLSRVANISFEQAEALMGDMAKRGILGPLNGFTVVGRWAKSKILVTDKVVFSRPAHSKAVFGPIRQNSN